MLKKVLLGLGGLIVLLLLVSFLLPSHTHVERSIVINAPASKVFKEVNNFTNRGPWDPWSEMDTAIVNTFSGPESGVGAKNEWKSKVVGDGSQVITESVPNEKVVSSLDFGHGTPPNASFKLSPEGSGTKVVWDIDMENGMNPMARYMGLMMDNMVGKQFEKGLQNLKVYVEGLPDEAPPVMEETMPADSSGAPIVE